MSIRLGAKTALHLASEGRFSTLLRKIGHRLHEGWYQEDVSYGLRRDLQAPFTAPAAKAPIYVRQIRPEDIETLCDGWRDDPELAWRPRAPREGPANMLRGSRRAYRRTLLHAVADEL